MGSSGGSRASFSSCTRYSSRPYSMFLTRSMTSPMPSGSMPRTSTPAVLAFDEPMASPATTGVAAATPGTRRTASTTGSQFSMPLFCPGRSTVMWALLPKILRLRSCPKPPMIETTEQSAHELTATPQIESTLITVRKPLFEARTCRAPTKGTNEKRSSRSSRCGNRAASTPSKKATPSASAPKRTSSCQST